MNHLFVFIFMLSTMAFAVEKTTVTLSPEEIQAMEGLRKLPPEQALAVYNSAMCAHTHPLVVYSAANTALEAQQPQAAQILYEQVLAVSPDFHYARLGIAKCLMKQGKWSEASLRLLSVIDHKVLENPYEAWMLTAHCHDEIGASIAVEQDTRHALQWKPNDIPARLLLLKNLIALNRLDEACSMAKELISQSPQDASLWSVLVKRELEQENWNNALQWIEMASAAGAQDTQFIVLRPLLLSRLNLPEAAAKCATTDSVLMSLDNRQRIDLAEFFYGNQYFTEAGKLLDAIDKKELTLSLEHRRSELDTRLKATHTSIP